jgi:hypothetical protein
MPNDEPHRNRAATSTEWHSKTDVIDLIHCNPSHRKSQDYCKQQETGKGRGIPPLHFQRQYKQPGKNVPTSVQKSKTNTAKGNCNSPAIKT